MVNTLAIDFSSMTKHPRHTGCSETRQRAADERFDAQRGDLVAIENNGDPGLGIVWLDPHLIVGKPERDEPPHIILVDTLEAHVTRAWRV